MQLAAANIPAYSMDYVIIKTRWVCSCLKDRGLVFVSAPTVLAKLATCGFKIYGVC
jgi:hypothetical protein